MPLITELKQKCPLCKALDIRLVHYREHLMCIDCYTREILTQKALLDKELKEIQANLKTQDNRSTRDPIFVVYDWEKVPSCSDYTDLWEYIDTDSPARIGKTKEEMLAWMENTGINVPENIDHYNVEGLFNYLIEQGYEVHKFYYIEKCKFITAFFTEKAAKDYIVANKHNLTSKVHIYAESLYCNYEMQLIRKLLMEGKI
jgi:hypothetical protein